MDDFRKAVPRGYPAGRHRHDAEDYVLSLLQRISLRAWLWIGAALLACVALAVWALVALWQSVGERAPAWGAAVAGFAGEVAPAADSAAVTAAGKDAVAGVAASVKTQVDQYAAQIDEVVPGASQQLKSAAQAWLGGEAAPGAGEGASAGGAAASGAEETEAP